MKKLTGNELTMLRGFADGKTYTQISSELGLSLNQAKALAGTLYRKLGVKHMSAAVAQGYRQGLLSDTPAAMERDWLLARASDEVRELFSAVSAAEEAEGSGDADTD